MNTEEKKSLDEQVISVLSEWSGYQIFVESLGRVPEFQVFLAGGAIRDILLGQTDKARDLDFFAPQKAIDLILPDLENTGHLTVGPFGSPRWYPMGNGPYCDIVPIERFDVGLGRCHNITELLNQFDFTGNAIAFELRTRRFVDPLKGTSDLQNRIMRAVRFDYPEKPFAQGHTLTCRAILWCRILRYATVLRLEIEPKTRLWLRENADCGSEYELFSRLFLGFEDLNLNACLEGLERDGN